MSKISPITAALLKKREQEKRQELADLHAALGENEYFLFSDSTPVEKRPYHRDELHRMLETGEITMFDNVLGKEHMEPTLICFVTYPDSMKKQAKKARRLIEDLEPVSNTSDAIAAGTCGCLGLPISGLFLWFGRGKTKGEQRSREIGTIIIGAIIIIFLFVMAQIKYEIFFKW